MSAARVNLELFEDGLSYQDVVNSLLQYEDDDEHNFDFNLNLSDNIAANEESNDFLLTLEDLFLEEEHILVEEEDSFF